MVEQGTANPDFFNYPSFFYDLYAVTTGAASALFGGSAEISGLNMGIAITEHEGLVLSLRFLTVVFGVGIVVAAAGLAWLLTRSRSAVFLAAGVTALHPLLVKNARWITPDTLTAFVTTLAVLAAVQVARRGTRGDYVLAGALVGLAASSKYNAALVGIAVLTAHLIRPERWRQVGRLALTGPVAAIAFLATTPYALLDRSAFWEGVTYDLDHYRGGHPGAQGGALGANLEWLWDSTGPLFLLLALVGVGLAVRRRLLLVPASFVVAYLALVSFPTVRFERNLLPVVPTLAVLAIVGLAAVWELAGRGIRSTRGRHALAILTIGVLFAWPLRVTLADTARSSRNEQAAPRSWIYEHVPRGSVVAVDSYTPWLDPDRYEIRAHKYLVSAVDALLDEGQATAFVMSSLGSGRYPQTADAIDKLKDAGCERGRFDATGPNGANRIDVFLLPGDGMVCRG